MPFKYWTKFTPVLEPLFEYQSGIQMAFKWHSNIIQQLEDRTFEYPTWIFLLFKWLRYLNVQYLEPHCTLHLKMLPG